MKRYTVFLLVLLGWFGTPAVATEYFGRFLDQLTGTWLPDPGDRPKFQVDRDFSFEDPNGFSWDVPAGTIVDGASVPQFLWAIAGPFEGDYLWASVIHDYYCDRMYRTAHDTHRVFYYGMRTMQVEQWKAEAMYIGVDWFGPQWTLIAAEPTAPPDLEDKVVLAAAKAKMAGIVRTLQWSNGEIIDVNENGPVAATPENIAQAADFYREVLASRSFLDDPARLGVLGLWTASIADPAAAAGFDPTRPVPLSLSVISGPFPATDAFILDANVFGSAEASWLAIDEIARSSK